jgi:NAD(P)H-dependent FMN reductase
MALKGKVPGVKALPGTNAPNSNDPKDPLTTGRAYSAASEDTLDLPAASALRSSLNHYSAIPRLSIRRRSAGCQRLKQPIQAADALLFVTPEYNR